MQVRFLAILRKFPRGVLVKKWLLSLVLAAAAIQATGMVLLSENRVLGFLDELEALSLRGESERYCAHLHEQLRVSIRDHSADQVGS